MVFAEDYLSDDSSFYGLPSSSSQFHPTNSTSGSDAEKEELERKARSFNPREYWKSRTPTLMEVAAQQKAADANLAQVPLYNPYEGMPAGRQLQETVDQFLRRLPPSTTEGSGTIPWIYIANPYSRPLAPKESSDIEKDQDGDIVLEDDAKRLSHSERERRFVAFGRNLLREFETTLLLLQRQTAGKPPMAYSTASRREREEIVRKLKNFAVACDLVSGKWLLFVPPTQVDEIWALIAHKTATNDLGTAAKVAPFDPGREPSDRVICVYTRDFNDKGDVIRVLRELKNMGLCDARRGIYYKCDAYSLLDIGSGNRWDIPPTLYRSGELLSEFEDLESSFSKKGSGR